MRRTGFGSRLKLGRRFLRGRVLLLESKKENDKHGSSHNGREVPNRRPICRTVFELVFQDPPSVEQASDEHAYSQGDEGDESLGSGTNIVRSPFVDIQLARKEEEVVANAVKKDAKESECLSIGSRVGEEEKVAPKPKRASQSKESFELRIF